MISRLWKATYLLLIAAACTPANETETMTEHRYTNALIHCSSPYLLQHAHNPVNWYPWSREALDKAKAEDKLLIVSIGYAACHWCHVMEHESFEDTAVAKLMNEHFVSIKVDREERPDIDNIYMNACMLITGRGGWPLNAICLPDGRPVYAGTYFPRDNWIRVLQYYQDLYLNDREKLEIQAAQVTQGIRDIDLLPTITAKEELPQSLPDTIWSKWPSRIDFQWGGRNGAPKFPMPDNWEYLLHYHHLYHQPQASEAVYVTLQRMAWGGIYDQLGGGFARYSVDGVWKVPHFEKMLYDNAQLIELYSIGYQYYKDELFLKIVEETTGFLQRELLDKKGGFYASLDADSEGEEGRFYCWTIDEIRRITQQDSPLIEALYNIKEEGNWEERKNVLFQTRPEAEIAALLQIELQAWHSRLSAAKERLWEAREQRIRPALDDKVLASWNALALKGLCAAYRATASEKYLELALQNARFMADWMIREDGRVWRNYKQQQSTIPGFLDDQALTMEALLALYEVTFDEQWLQLVQQILDYTLAHYAGGESGLFYFTSDEDDALISRNMEISDNVIASSNSVMAAVLWQYGHLIQQQAYTDRSKQMVATMADAITEQPFFHSSWAQVLLQQLNTPFEVAIVGPEAHTLRQELQRHYLPDVWVMGSIAASKLPLLQGKLQPGKTLIYVCKDKVCHRPVATVQEALDDIQSYRYE